MNQQPGFYRRRVGEWTITALNDGTLDLPREVLVNVDKVIVDERLAAAFRPAEGLRVTVNAFLLQGRGRTVLIDAGSGAMSPDTGRLMANLAAAGVAPGTIEAVLLTHLHPDHTGSLATDGAATFPAAELVLAEAEAAHWLGEAALAAAPAAARPYFESANAATRPYAQRTRRVSGEAEVLPGITIVPLPGHTPGHSGFRLDDGAESLLLWGDIMHVPEVQAPHPRATMAFDADPALAASTRLRLLDAAASDRLAFAGAHLHFPAFNHIIRDGEGYRLVPDTWSPSV